MHEQEASATSPGPTGWARTELTPAPVLTEVERQRLLYEWNATETELPNVCAHELFERQVERAPDAVAVLFGEQRLTYRQLNQCANQVAHFLRKRGVGPETLVGVSLERNPNLVISLLGVWKAGGAYVPLDTTYPAERLTFMVEDSAIRVLLTEQKCRHLYPSFADKMVCVDAEWETIAREWRENPRAGAVPSNLAYVMYTSGSTGRPKGAMILHGGLVNYLTWAIKTYALAAGGSVPVHTSVSFDLTVTSLYPALLSGGQVDLLTEDVAAQSLLAALRRGKDRNLVKITPAHLDLLGQQLRADEVAGLTRLFVIGGENLPAESLQLWRDFAPGTRLINEYGPTETVVGCCVYEVRPDDPRNGPVPIGRPIANTRLYVLDPDLQPVPVGVMGELYIGGAGVARGYLNRPELTRERFLQDPFCGQPEARMYKTGDLARYRPDGVLEYLGRVDDQVKVRGYRIELGEIEAAMAGHPAVQSCAVVVREDPLGNKQLVAYVVARQGESASVADLQDFAKSRLPDYMVPGQFVPLDALPLTNNGKVDRRALPPPTALAAPSATAYRAPRSPTEGTLAEIWQHLLQRDRIGTRDDFFDAGGHSMLMLALLSEIRDKLGVELELATVLRNPTIESLAGAIDAIAGPAEPVVAAAPPPHQWLTELRGGGPKSMFFVYDGDGELLPYMNLARRMPAEFAVWGISPFRLPGIPLAHLTIPEMARHCVQNMQVRQPHGPYFLGGLCAGGEIAFEAARQLEEQGEVVEAVLLLDAVQPTTPHRPWLQSTRRWRRFMAVFDGHDEPPVSAEPSGASTSPGPAASGRAQRATLTEAARKVRNLIRYEGIHSVDSAWIYVRQQLLKRLLANGSAWPPWIPSLTVREIYDLCARANYRPGTVRGHVILVKAGEGGGEEDRGSELVADPFLGWKEYAVGRLDVMDAPGGHSGMLQEPNVDRLVRELVHLLASGSRGRTAGADDVTSSVSRGERVEARGSGGKERARETDEFTAPAPLPWYERPRARLRQGYRHVRTNLLRLRLRLTNTRGVVVIQYHSVPDPETARFISPGNRMEPDLFQRQMEFIARDRHVIDIGRLLHVIDGKQEAERGSVLLVFDDGYRDNWLYVAALLDSLQLPAVFYLPTRLITRGDLPWIDVLYSAFRYRTRSHLRLPGMADQFNLDDPDQARAAYHSLRATFIETDLPTRSSLLERIVGDLAPSESPPRLLMSWEEAREIRRQYPRISFGVHGAEHLDLTAQSPDVVAADLDACKEDFEREIGESPQHFAYPYNRSNESSRGNLRERGFRSAMTSGTDVLVGSHTDALGIPRLDAPTDFQLLSHWTLGAFYSRRAKVH